MVDVPADQAQQSPRPTAETVISFLHALKLSTHSRPVATGVTCIVTDDERSLVNTFVCFEDATPARDVINGTLVREDLDVDRTVAIFPDMAWDAIRRLRSAVSTTTTPRVVVLSQYLDAHLRPNWLCESLIDGSEYAGGWLREDDFIAQSGLVDGVRIDALQHLYSKWAPGQSPRLCMVLAPAGHGKSKVTHILAKRLARKYLGDETGSFPPLPFLISFSQYRRSTAFKALIMLELERPGRPDITIDAFLMLVRLGRILFILDGYDEMLEAVPETAKGNIAEFVQGSGGNSRIILTSRSVFYRTSVDVIGDMGDPTLADDEIQILDLQPFDRSQARAYLAKRLAKVPDGAQVLERAQRALEDKHGLAVLQNPFFLSEFAGSIEQRRWSVRDLRRQGFLEFLIESVCAGARATGTQLQRSRAACVPGGDGVGHADDRRRWVYS